MIPRWLRRSLWHLISSERKYVMTDSVLKKKVLIFLFAAVFLIAAGCENNKTDMPRELIGNWVSDEPGYEERYLIVENKVITIGTGQIKADLYFIKKIDISLAGKTKELTIDCEKQGNVSFTFRVVYDPTRKDDVLYFENRPHVTWFKTSQDPR